MCRHAYCCSPHYNGADLEILREFELDKNVSPCSFKNVTTSSLNDFSLTETVPELLNQHTVHSSRQVLLVVLPIVANQGCAHSFTDGCN